MGGKKKEPVGRSSTDIGVCREVGLALRAHRRERGESQRAYATARELSRAHREVRSTDGPLWW